MLAGKKMKFAAGRLLPGFAAVLSLAAISAGGQQSQYWRSFRKIDGLAESACDSVTLGLNGQILVSHRRTAVSQLDGYSVSNYPPLEPELLRVSATPGGQLWALTAQGLAEWNDGAWVQYPVREIAAAHRSAVAPNGVTPSFFSVRQGRVIFLTADALMDFNTDDPRLPQTRLLLAAAATRAGKFLSMSHARDDGLWIGCQNGLVKISGPLRNLGANYVWQNFPAPDFLGARNFSSPVEDVAGAVACVADSSSAAEKLWVKFENGTWSAFSSGGKNLLLAWRDADATEWAMTADSLLELDEARNEFRVIDELPVRQYFDAAVEPGGAFWLATSDGLFRHAPPAWRVAFAPAAGCVKTGADGGVWFLAGDELCSLDGNARRAYPLPEAARPVPQRGRGIHVLNPRELLVTAAGRWWKFEAAAARFSPTSSAGEAVFANAPGVLKEGVLCFQTAPSAETNRQGRLEIFDGEKFQPFNFAPPETEFGGRISAMLATQDGDVWLASEQGIAWLHEKKWRMFPAADKIVPGDAIAFVETPAGKIWCAAPDRIQEFDGRDWLVVRAGFDHVNDLLRSRDGSMWVATDAGLHRFFRGAWIENGVEEGLPSQTVNALCEDGRGRIWAGTARGLAVYAPAPGAEAPQVAIRRLSEKDGDIPEGGTITLAFSGRAKWKSTPAARLLYSYHLDQHDWSEFLDANSVSFTDLPPGKHYFQVRAMDRNGNITAVPAKTEFAVVLLWYHDTRLLMISLAGLVAALFFASLSYNRHRQLVRSYAEVEHKVAERTRELELANRELLHSQKMNALGTLAAGIAHDFNNILSIVKGSAQIIEDNTGNPEKIRTRVDRIKTVVEQGAGVVNAMLGFSRESNGAPALCDLNEIISDTIRLLGDRFHHEVEVDFTPAKNLPAVRAAKDFVQQILLNFIFNAAESMPQARRIVITAGSVEKCSGGLVLAPAETGAAAFISVRDFGCGIPPENLPRIFEPFFTTKAMSTRRGTGLGLSMVYELAKKLGAGIAVESVVGQGSAFTLLLPVDSKMAPSRLNLNTERK